MKSLPDEEVNVKISTCGTCNGIVHVAVEHLMDTKSKNDFAKEAMKYNLAIKTKPLLDYRKENAAWCQCKIL